jgi:hypothetical protein
MLRSLTFGGIPGGTSNAFVMNILTLLGEEYSAENTAFIIAKGRTMKMDLTELETEY